MTPLQVVDKTNISSFSSSVSGITPLPSVHQLSESICQWLQIKQGLLFDHYFHQSQWATPNYLHLSRSAQLTWEARNVVAVLTFTLSTEQVSFLTCSTGQLTSLTQGVGCCCRVCDVFGLCWLALSSQGLTASPPSHNSIHWPPVLSGGWKQHQKLMFAVFFWLCFGGVNYQGSTKWVKR